MEASTIELHYKHGLPITVDKDAIISIVIPPCEHRRSSSTSSGNSNYRFYNNKYSITYYVWPKLKQEHRNHTLKRSIYDIHQYIPSTYTNYALFSTIEEHESINNFYKKNNKDTSSTSQVHVHKKRLPEEEDDVTV